MGKWIGLFFVFFFPCVSFSAQTAGSCSREKDFASVPKKTWDALNAAEKIKNPNERSAKVIDIARKTDSGLKASFVLKNNGVIVDYIVVVAESPGCTVASMHFNRGRF